MARRGGDRAAGRPRWSTGRRARIVCAVAVLAGAAWSGARLDALDRPAGLVTTTSDGAVIRATLDESPRPTPFGWRALARAGDRRLLLRGRGPAPGWWPGDEVHSSGRLRALDDRDGWLRARHVHGVLDARYSRLTGARRGGAAGVVDAIRRRAAGALGARLPRPEAGLLRGMTLGDESRLPRASLDSLRAAGLGHIVAASGQNVALLALLVQAVGIVAGLGWRARLALTLGLVALYVPLAGGGASIQRAGVMGAAAIVAALSARPAARWHALLLAAAVTLALDPASLEQPGWQLSFAAVAAIALLGAPLSSALARRGIPRPLAAAIAITLAATAGTAPVSAAVFGTVSITGIVANVLVAPVIAPITWLGMVASALAQPWPAGGEAIAALAGPPLAFVLGVAGALDVAPARVSAPIAGGVSLALALLIAGPRARLTLADLARGARHTRDRDARARRRPAGPVPAVLAVAAAVAVLAWPAIHSRGRAIGPPPAGVLRVSFLDVGQGDATLLQAGAGALLVDSGRPDGPILDELRQAGVSRLSALVATHAQADHLGGASAVLRAIRVGLLVDGRDGVAETHGRRMAARRRGTRSAIRRADPRRSPARRRDARRRPVAAAAPAGRRRDRRSQRPRARAARQRRGRPRAAHRRRRVRDPRAPRTCRSSTCSRSATTGAPIPGCRRCCAACARASR